MKPRLPSTARLSFPLASAIAALLTISCAQATVYYWDSDGTTSGFGSANGTWGSSAFWSTDSGGTATPANTTIFSTDDINFGTAANNYTGTVTLDGNKTARSISFGGAGVKNLRSDGTARTLTLGSGGITIASGSGAVTLGNGTTGTNVLLNLSGAQTWTNSSASAFTFNNTAATFSRQTGATLLFNKASTGNFAVTSGVSNTNSIIGPWAFFGTGANQRYATISSGNVAGLTGTSTNGLSVTGATTNYEVSGSALTLGGSLTYTANTIRYAGTGATFQFYSTTNGASAFTTNGILAVGASGILNLNRNSTTGNARLIVGNTGELVISGQQAVTINVPIVDGASASDLTYSGSNTLILSQANTYSGETTVSSGTLRLNNSLALQNSSLNTSGSIAGDSTNGLKTTLTALTLGGLTGNKDLASLFTTTAGGYGTVANLTLNPGSSVSYSGVIANGAANMNLIKDGAGAQTLSGVNTYTGTTTISGGTLILNNANALGTTPGVNGTSSISMAAGTTLRSDYIIEDAGNVNSFVYAPITLSGTGSVNFHIGAGSSTAPAEAVTFNLNGAIGGTAGTNVVFSTSAANTSNGDSTYVLGAASTYDGNTTITAGNSQSRINVKAGVANALPTTTVLNFDNMVGNGTGRTSQYDLNGNDQTLAGLSNGGDVPNFRNQRVTNTGALATLTINNSEDFTFGGATTATNGSGTNTARAQITGNIALVKSGAGTFTLGGTLTGGATASANTYTGTTTVTDGKLVVNGSISTSSLTTVQIGATLGGIGTVGALTIDLGGTLAPGNSPGILNVNGAYIQNGTLSLELNGTTAGSLSNQHDRVNVTGSVTLNGLLAATVGYVPVANDLLFILLNDDVGSDAITGTFTGLAQGDTVSLGGYDWQISYTADSVGGTFLGGNDVALMAVPEPRAALLGGLGLLALLRRRRN